MFDVHQGERETPKTVPVNSEVNAENAPENEWIVFKRAADTLSRRDITLLYRTVVYDEREEIYKQLVRGCHRSPTFALAVLERAADRIHGKPPQHIVAESRRVTIFALEPPRDPQRDAQEAAAEVVEAVAPVVDDYNDPPDVEG